LKGPDPWEGVVRGHLLPLFRLCTVILGDPQEAEDAVQEVFLKAFRAQRWFRRRSTTSTWLTRIAINICRDRLRGRRRRREVMVESLPPLVDPNPGPAESLASRQLVLRAMEGLSAREEMVVRLRFGGGLTARDMAGILGCSVSSVKTHLRRALRKMAERLEKEP